jgi:hypothetical protein
MPPADATGYSDMLLIDPYLQRRSSSVFFSEEPVSTIRRKLDFRHGNFYATAFVYSITRARYEIVVESV